jgi:hypothetical protein
MVRVIVAVVLTAIVQFAWGFAFHGPLSGMQYMTSKSPDEPAVSAALKGTLPETGTYLLPMCPGCHADEEQMKAHEKRAGEGPIALIHYRKEGFSMAQMPVVMGTGFFHLLLTGLVAAFLLRLALPGLPSYRSRVGFVLVLGVFAAVATRLSDLIWFHYHWAFTLGQVVFFVTAWLLGGVVMAAIIRPASQQALAAKPQHPSTSAA